MPHLHSIYDTDSHFSINPITREIKNNSSLKIVLMQHDHNSERFTFELPRFVEGHDMSLCTKIEVHYINISSTNKNDKSEDVYLVDDVQISPEDDNVVIFSWLISGNATKYSGSLYFLISFKCLTDETIEYAWHTKINKGKSIGEGMNNGEAVIAEYSDVLEAWKAEALTEIAEAKSTMLEEIELAAEIVQTTGDSETAVMSQKAVTERLSEIASKTILPNMYNYEGAEDKIGFGVSTTGVISPMTGATVSEYIPVEAGKNYSIGWWNDSVKLYGSSPIGRIWVYNENKQPLQSVNKTFTAPEGACYVVVQINLSKYADAYKWVVLVEGDTLPTEYVEYGYKINFTDKVAEDNNIALKVELPNINIRTKINVFKSSKGYYSDFDITKHRLTGGITYFISPNGNDNNDGYTPYTAFLTIEKALAKSDCKTIVLTKGTYTLGTHFTSGVDVGGHNLIGIDAIVDSVEGTGAFNCNSTAYIEGVTFINGDTPFTATMPTTGGTLYCYKCKFNNAKSANGFTALGGNYYMVECEASNNYKDGFNYHQGGAGAPHIVEIGCYGYVNGTTSNNDLSSNGSTVHNGGAIIRLNCKYSVCYGGVIAESQSSSINIACEASCSTIHLSNTVSVNYDARNANYWACGSTMYLIGCKSYGSKYDIASLGYPNLESPTKYSSVYTDNEFTNNAVEEGCLITNG